MFRAPSLIVMTCTKDPSQKDSMEQAGELFECENKAAGCTAQLTHGILKEHLAKGCDFRRLSCGLNCGAEGLLSKFLDKHEKESCSNRVVPCPNQCGIADLTFATLKQHAREQCLNRLVVCSNACGVHKLLACKVDEHCRSGDCPREKVDCPFKESLGCNERIERGKLLEHTESVKGLQVHLLKATEKLYEATHTMTNLAKNAKKVQDEAQQARIDSTLEINTLHEDINTLNGKLVESKQEANREIATLHIETAVAAIKISKLEEEAQSSRVTRFFFHQQIEALTQGCKETNHGIVSFHNDINATTSEIRVLQQNMADMQLRVEQAKKEAKQEIAALHNELEVITTEMCKLVNLVSSTGVLCTVEVSRARIQSAIDELKKSHGKTKEVIVTDKSFREHHVRIDVEKLDDGRGFSLFTGYGPSEQVNLPCTLKWKTTVFKDTPQEEHDTDEREFDAHNTWGEQWTLDEWMDSNEETCKIQFEKTPYYYSVK